MRIMNIQSKSQSGFTLIEILVAGLVLAIGILGMATMMLSSLKSDQSAYYRSMASIYAADMADRIRMNQDWAIENNSYNNISTEGTIPAAPTCLNESNGCDEATIADLDVREWSSNFTNVYNVANFKSAIPNAVGTVVRGDGDNVFVITISWNEVDWDANDPGQRSDSEESLSLNVVL